MSDQIYTSQSENTSNNFVIIAEACGRGVLTKTNFANGTQKSYDLVKYFNFSEYEISDLHELYALSIGMLTQPKSCFIRARIKDPSKARNVVRKTNGDEATLVLEKFNWFALDIDWKKESSGNLKEDCDDVLNTLHIGDYDCFAVASSSYGFKPGINMRIFLWANRAVSGVDVKNWLGDTKGVSDPAILNPAQIIYTAAPLGIDPMIDKSRIVWLPSMFNKDKGIDVRITDHWNMRGAPEIVYNKDRAILNANAHYNRIGLLDVGYRHPGLINECIPLGKLVGQGHFDRDEVIDKAYAECNNWRGPRDTKKDIETIKWAVDKGIAAMSVNKNVGEF
jgi:hypothetical protein